MRKYLIISLCLSLIGCAHLSDKPGRDFVEPRYGMTKPQMVALLGKPDSIEIYRKSDKTRVEFYIYTKRYKSSQENVPVCFMDNKVVGWGKTFYEDHVSMDDTRIR